MVMQLEMYLDGQLVDTAVVYAPMLKQAHYLKGLMAELEKKYAPVLKNFHVKPVYVLHGVPSCINNFVPLPSQISQITNAPMPVANTLEPAPLREANPQKSISTPMKNHITSSKIKAA